MKGSRLTPEIDLAAEEVARMRRDVGSSRWRGHAVSRPLHKHAVVCFGGSYPPCSLGYRMTFQRASQQGMDRLRHGNKAWLSTLSECVVFVVDRKHPTGREKRTEIQPFQASSTMPSLNDKGEAQQAQPLIQVSPGRAICRCKSCRSSHIDGAHQSAPAGSAFLITYYFRAALTRRLQTLLPSGAHAEPLEDLIHSLPEDFAFRAVVVQRRGCCRLEATSHQGGSHVRARQLENDVCQ